MPAKEVFAKPVRTIFLASEGIRLDKVAVLLGEKYDTVQKRVRRAVKAGILVQTPGSWPVYCERGPNYENWKATSIGQGFYGGKRKGIQPSTKINASTPHRFQVQYDIGSSHYVDTLGLPGLRRRYHLARFDERPELSAVWETHTLTIAVKKFCRGTPQEKVKDGLKTALEYAQAHNAAGARLRFRRLLGRIEWIISDQALSDYLVRVLGLKAGMFIQINMTQWGLDSSHPENVEIDAQNPHPVTKPTENVETLDFLLDREKLLGTVRLLKEKSEVDAVEQAAQARELHAVKEELGEARKLLSEVVNGFVALRQQIEMKKSL